MLRDAYFGRVRARVFIFFFFQAEDGIRDPLVTGVQTCALPILLYSINFHPARPLTDEDLAREKDWRGIHTENISGTDHAVRNKDNDYLIDRALQASGKSYTGMKGLGTQDCAIQESMGPIADRAAEYLLASDPAIAKIPSLLLQTRQ